MDDRATANTQSVDGPLHGTIFISVWLLAAPRPTACFWKPSVPQARRRLVSVPAFQADQKSCH